MPKRRLLIVDVAALSWNMVSRYGEGRFDFRKTDSVFPAVTCPVQASFRTASFPSAHGVVANGFPFPELHKYLFWEQSSALVEGDRIWSTCRERGSKIGMMFWQQSLGESADLLLSPRPIHKHHGGMIQDCYAVPDTLFQHLNSAIGKPFNLMHYWGPLASAKSSAWITEAARRVMQSDEFCPDVLFLYLPHLDYDLQRHGPASDAAGKAFELTISYLQTLREAAERAGMEYLFFGDYAMEEADGGVIFPNRILRDAGLFRVCTVKGMTYPDHYRSSAFAMVDHQVAHVYVPSPDDRHAVCTLFRSAEGIASVSSGSEIDALHLSHRRTGQVVLTAEKGYWFAYPWWTDRKEAPDYASHVDIHNKPGFDPCELFFGWPPPSTSLDTARIRGTHGRTGPGMEVAWTTSLSLPEEPGDIVGLAKAVRNWLLSE